MTQTIEMTCSPSTEGSTVDLGSGSFLACDGENWVVVGREQGPGVGAAVLVVLGAALVFAAVTAIWLRGWR